MRSFVRALVCGSCAWLGASAASAVVLGASDGFGNGSTDGWFSGAASPVPPVNVADGGPAGAGDGYLLATALGGSGPGSRLVVIGGPQWAGDYAAAGVDAITMDLRNFGSADLSVRLALFGGGGAGVSVTPVLLPAGGDWQSVSFSLAPSALAGNLPGLGAIAELRIFNGGLAQFPGDAMAGRLGIDNIAAVPEPAPAALLACGLALLAWRARRAHF